MTTPEEPRPHSPAAIRAAREAAGLTREVAAHAAGISVATLRDAEKGRDSRGSTLAALAAVYGVSIDEFFAHGDDATPGDDSPGEKQSGPGPLTLAGSQVGAGAGIGG